MAVKAEASITLVRVDDGVAGKGVLKTEVYYYLSTSNVDQSGGSWVTTPPAWTNGKYYWQKIKTTYTDNTTNESKPVCITGEKGQMGNTGVPGQSVTSIATQFYLSNSKKELEGGSWVDLMPEWSVGKYLWTRSKIIYSNPSATKYTSPICDSSWEAVNNIEIGGRNLLLNSDREFTNDSSSAQAEFITLDYNLTPIIKENGEDRVYSLSFDLKSKDISKTDKISIYPYPGNPNPNTYVFPTTSVIVSTVYKRYSITFVPTLNNVSNTTTKIALYGTYETGNIPVIRNVKFEIGNKATDWTPAPEDMTSKKEVDALLEINSDNIISTVKSTYGSRLDVSETMIEQLSDTISSMVTDSDGTSLMTQTSSGWTFNIGEIQSTLDNAANELNSLTGNVDGINDAVSNLNDLVTDLGKKTAYIVMSTDETGNPCIELGKEDNPFKVRITNTSVDFIEGTSKIAYVNNRSLYIERSVIRDELQIGEGSGFIWKRRSNGNMGLRWTGGDS